MSANTNGRWPTNGTFLTPSVLVALFLRRHGWSRTKCARVLGRKESTVSYHIEAALAALGVTAAELDVLLVRGGELRQKKTRRAA